jgi:hypothetical protein
MSRHSGKLFQDMIGSLLVVLKIGFEIIREKEQFEDRKHDNELDEDDLPQGSTHGHILETVTIK